MRLKLRNPLRRQESLETAIARHMTWERLYEPRLTEREIRSLAALAYAQGSLHLISPSGDPKRAKAWNELAVKTLAALEEGDE